MIVPPYCSRHSHTRSTNASRPSSSRARALAPAAPLDLRLGGDAGVVGAEDPLRPLARACGAWRIRQSWIESLSAWPMCSAPVTFGGGIAIE